jgi:hypothetical protein
MEVHHHSHTSHPPAGKTGKKWTHYFWEFLMLFLAVFCGFLAENQREHMIEHQREKQFALLLYDDLKKDTAWLSRVIKIKKWRGQKLDSLIYYLSVPDLQKNANQIYYYTAFLKSDNFFSPNDATIQQLRNSGSLRYFSNLKLYNTITLYYNDCAFYLEKEKERKPVYPDELRSAIFDANDLSSFSTTATLDIMEGFPFPEKKMHLLSNDKKDYNRFLHFINDLKMGNSVSILFLESFITDDVTGLIRDLKKEYSIK